MTDKQPTGQEPEYIITDSQLRKENKTMCISDSAVKRIRSRPYHPAPEQCPHWVSSANLKSDFRDQDIGRFYCNQHPIPEQPIPSSKELIVLAEHDWHNWEERRHRHPMIPWTHGWITGFLTENKPNWNKAREETTRQSERENILNHLEQWADVRMKAAQGITYYHGVSYAGAYENMLKEIESLRRKVE